MLTSRGPRLLALAVLCSTLAALTIWFGALQPAPELGAYPTEDDLGADYPTHVGDPAQVSGTVVATDPVVLVAEYEAYTGDGYRTGDLRLTVRDLETPTATGDHLQVFGTVRPDRTIDATDAVAVPDRNFLYTYLVSFVAGCWVLARLARGWTVEWSTLAVRPRDDLSCPDTEGRDA
ncbi:hypothetical protein [Halomarina litorea]|uniref:hypothetical protein n=1 Tax=Halomarina litorea TaxID=2961595 RepID=UPI0020C2CBE1|nr:hypothetical protein [Halomarina sp. BCD28]